MICNNMWFVLIHKNNLEPKYMHTIPREFPALQ